MKERKLLFSITKDQFEEQHFTAKPIGGGGGNTSNTGIRLIHKSSGAVGEGREYRSQSQNKKAALERLVKTKEFKSWHKLECAKRLHEFIPETPEQIKERVDKMVDDGLKNGTIKIEEF